MDGDRGRGFGEYYWLVGRRAVESRIWGKFLGGGWGIFAAGRGRGGGARLILQVQSHMLVQRQAEVRSVCVSRVQDRTCVGCNATATGVL